MALEAGSGLNSQIREEACEWFVEFRGGKIDATQRRGFDAWLRKSPEHLRAYLEIAAIWNDGLSVDPDGKWDTGTLLAQAATTPDNVVAIEARGAVVPVNAAPPRVASPDAPRRFLALAASVLIACAAAWHYAQRNVYATDVGEQRSIRLADGSTVDLNSRSRIEIRYSGDRRAIELLDGQALFQVAKDARRPFVVTSGDTRVRAVGTQFDVNRKKTGTIVTVLEGTVAVVSEHPTMRAASLADSAARAGSAPGTPGARGSALDTRGEPPARAVYLSAGEQLDLATAVASRPATVNVAAATAWKQRHLMFESATLTEVAEEFNRYNERQLVVRGAADLYGFHISGTFSSIEPDGLLDFLRAQPGVEVTETDSGYLVSRKSH
jgi:transmembrane sensor